VDLILDSVTGSGHRRKTVVIVNQNKGTPKGVSISYQLLRNTTSPDEKSTGVKSFVAKLSAFEIVKLDTTGNLRDYIAAYNPRKRNHVHQAIRTTVLQDPDRFITRNGGFVISASSIEVNDNAKEIMLEDATILNGAQSQGEIRRWIEETYGENDIGSEETPFHVRAEIVVDPDPSEVIETAIARNTATPVKSISQAGGRGQLDDLAASIAKRKPNLTISMSETDHEAFDTRKILQFTRLLMPQSVSKNDTPAEKLRAYKNPAQCLTEFTQWHDTKKIGPEAKAKYDFTVQKAPYAIEEYEYWANHAAWNGQGLFENTKKGGRAVRRDKSRKVIWVSPGLVFPIMGAMSEFVEEHLPGPWRLSKPKLFKPGEMISRTVTQFRGLDSDPMQMGRNAGTYDALRIYPATIVTVMQDMKTVGD
jgi:hypothetical protein